MDDVHTIGIIGAGAKGREIARLALLGGYRVMLEDMSASRLAESSAAISAALDAAAARGEIDNRRKKEVAGNLSTTQSVDEVSRGGDLLIDAAPDEAELQLEIFTILDKFAKPTAIFASTADSISIADLAEITNCPEQCVGLRFPERSKESESLTILRGPKTSEHTVQLCVNAGRKMGLEAKIITESADLAGADKESHRL
jgi:3-hydroxybutyryl-CoA dehydrogenase